MALRACEDWYKWALGEMGIWGQMGTMGSMSFGASGQFGANRYLGHWGTGTKRHLGKWAFCTDGRWGKWDKWAPERITQTSGHLEHMNTRGKLGRMGTLRLMCMAIGGK